MAGRRNTRMSAQQAFAGGTLAYAQPQYAVPAPPPGYVLAQTPQGPQYVQVIGAPVAPVVPEPPRAPMTERRVGTLSMHEIGLLVRAITDDVSVDYEADESGRLTRIERLSDEDAITYRGRFSVIRKLPAKK